MFDRLSIDGSSIAGLNSEGLAEGIEQHAAEHGCDAGRVCLGRAEGCHRCRVGPDPHGDIARSGEFWSIRSFSRAPERAILGVCNPQRP
jgi:hypothetical protein